MSCPIFPDNSNEYFCALYRCDYYNEDNEACEYEKVMEERKRRRLQKREVRADSQGEE
jgi:hypothetical protein